MNDDHIIIYSHLNEKPHRQRVFTVQCFQNRIRTTVTSTPAVVRNWIFFIRRLHYHRREKLIVGLGVQWCPSYYATPPQAATLQLCVGGRCLVFQLQRAPSVPIALRRFLCDPLITFVGVWTYIDRSMLWKCKHNILVSNIVDIRVIAAAERGVGPKISMEKLAEILLGFRNVKKPNWVGKSNWNSSWLSEDQVQYACVDAFLSFSMGKELRAWNWKSASSKSQILLQI